MTVTNDFLPFAAGAGANVLTQSDYQALAARPGGFIAGVANSAQLNKVWRQSSIMAALIGQFIADVAGDNAVDDGTIATLLSSFEKALRVVSQNYCVAGGTVNAVTGSITPAPAALTAGLRVSVKLAGPTTNTMTFNLNSLGAQAVVQKDGTAVPVGSGGAGWIANLEYDGTNWQWATTTQAATLAEVIAGVIANKYVSPATLRTKPAVVLTANGTSSQSVASGVFTVVTDLVAVTNTLNDATFSAGTFTMGTKDAGTWLLTFIGAFILAGTLQQLEIYKNGTRVAYAQAVGNGSGSGESPVIFALSLAAGDVITYKAYQVSGSTRTFNDAQIVALRIGG